MPERACFPALTRENVKERSYEGKQPNPSNKLVIPPVSSAFFPHFLPKDLHVDSFYRIYTIERVKRASPLNLMQDIPLSEVRLYDL